MAEALRATQLTQRYSTGKIALKGIDLLTTPGIVGLLGPNGAGKTSLLRILATVFRPTTGTLTWGGIDLLRNPTPYRQTLGYLPQHFAAPAYRTGRDVVAAAAAMRGVTRAEAPTLVEQVLTATNLEEVASTRVGAYSGGMIRRLGIAQAFVHNPQFVLVDEPTAGLDPEERVRFRALMQSFAPSRTILISTHIVGDIEALAQRVIILHAGIVAFDGSPAQLLADSEGYIWEGEVTSAEAQALTKAPDVTIFSQVQQRDGVRVRLYAKHPPASSSFQLASPTLEDAYLAVQGQVAGALLAGPSA